jgi:hypothetical protein
MNLPEDLEIALSSGPFLSLISCYSQHSLQTGMKGVFGKLQGLVSRIHIGQVVGGPTYNWLWSKAVPGNWDTSLWYPFSVLAQESFKNGIGRQESRERM